MQSRLPPAGAASPKAPTTPPPPTTTPIPQGPTNAIGVASSNDVVDEFESVPTRLSGTPTASPPGAGPGGLPDVLMRTPAATVRHGHDPGDFYCEHTFFTTQEAANAASTSIVKNPHGEALVGFLHVPSDPQTYQPAAVDDQAARHAGTREVVGAALRGYVDEIHRSGQRPARVLLTGFGSWESVQNNPTGDFVAHRENVDAAMRQAFGRRLLTREGVRVGGDDSSEVWSYRVQDGATGRAREVRIEARRLPVTDDAINGSAHSLQQAIGRFRPHAVISMGVHGGADFLAEHHADDGGLRVENGRQRHDGTAVPTRSLPPNFSLPRAIDHGSRANPAVVSDLSVPAVDRSLQAFAHRRG
jgi:pyrrolidone-carboxylate peptidase